MDGISVIKKLLENKGGMYLSCENTGEIVCSGQTNNDDLILCVPVSSWREPVTKATDVPHRKIGFETGSETRGQEETDKQQKNYFKKRQEHFVMGSNELQGGYTVLKEATKRMLIDQPLDSDGIPSVIPSDISGYDYFIIADFDNLKDYKANLLESLPAWLWKHIAILIVSRGYWTQNKDEVKEIEKHLHDLRKCLNSSLVNSFRFGDTKNVRKRDDLFNFLLTRFNDRWKDATSEIVSKIKEFLRQNQSNEITDFAITECFEDRFKRIKTNPASGSDIVENKITWRLCFEFHELLKGTDTLWRSGKDRAKEFRNDDCDPCVMPGSKTNNQDKEDRYISDYITEQFERFGTYWPKSISPHWTENKDEIKDIERFLHCIKKHLDCSDGIRLGDTTGIKTFGDLTHFLQARSYDRWKDATSEFLSKFEEYLEEIQSNEITDSAIAEPRHEEDVTSSSKKERNGPSYLSAETIVDLKEHILNYITDIHLTDRKCFEDRFKRIQTNPASESNIVEIIKTWRLCCEFPVHKLLKEIDILWRYGKDRAKEFKKYDYDPCDPCVMPGNKNKYLDKDDTNISDPQKFKRSLRRGSGLPKHQRTNTTNRLVELIVKFFFVHIIFSTIGSKCFPIQLINAEYCEISSNSMRIVKSCPGNLEAWTFRSKLKNCSAFYKNTNCSSPENFVYHCVIDHFMSVKMEMCAQEAYINLGYCAEYNTLGELIQANYDAKCQHCPDRYLSSEAYKYQECYNMTYTPEISTEKYSNITEDKVTSFPNTTSTGIPTK